MSRSRSSGRVQGHTARKRFGQHFLTDAAVLDKIAHRLNLDRDDTVIEIGPGLGALTAVLLDQLASLTAVELDRDLAARLMSADWEGPSERLTVVQADALQVDWWPLLPADGTGTRLVGNLPYNISSPLLIRLIDYRVRILDQHFMLQKELVQRIVAQGGADYGRLGILLQAFYDCESILDVAPEAFSPPPRVQSAIVRMSRREQSMVNDAGTLSELLRAGFSQRRKMLRSTLLPWLQNRGWQPQDGPLIDPQARPQDLPRETWYQLSDRLDCLKPGRQGSGVG